MNAWNASDGLNRLNEGGRVVLLAPDPPAAPAAPAASQGVSFPSVVGDAASWQAAWAQTGLRVCASVHACSDLVHAVQVHAPQGVVVWTPVVDEVLCQTLVLLHQCAPVPVLLCLTQHTPVHTTVHTAAQTTPALATPLAELAGCGVHVLWVDPLHPPPPLGAVWSWTAQVFAAQQQQQARLLESETRWRERVVVDKAKGILMQTQHLSDEEAFGLLRRTSMSRSQRLGELARQVVTSAQQAQCINRSGQLRMLSQRLSALGLFELAGLTQPFIQQAHQEAVAKVEFSLRLLKQQPWADPPSIHTHTTSASGGSASDPRAVALSAVVDAWQRMQQLKLPRRAASAAPSLRYLGDVQARALQLSTAADQLTSHLEAASQATPLKWLNTVARQRMLCQRYTQQLLLQRWLRQGDAAGVLQAAQSDTRQELQAVLSQLNHLPLRNEAIDACLTQVGADWMALLHAGQHLLALPVGQGAEAHAVLTVVFERSEAVLTGFETLTRHFETSLEWLLA